jgi:hypothetical protein
MEILEAVEALAEAVGHVFVATAGEDGVPHLASAGRMRHAGGERVAVSEWFCPGTMANLEENRSVAVVVWNAEDDRGHQVVGRVEDVRERSVVDGYVPEPGETPPPQVERELIIGVEKVLHFSQGPHSDEAEGSDEHIS